jgi:diacylglycerol kinase (ATP)
MGTSGTPAVPVPPRKRALLLVNRASRRGAMELDAALEVLSAQGIEVVQAHPERAEEVPQMIRVACEEVDRVIVGGGDGTINLAAEALLECGLPLGILPMGTANDLARTLQIPDTLAEACAVITAGRLKLIDLGRVNGRYFFNVASIGLGARVSRQLTREQKGRWGVLGYARGVLRAFSDHRPFRAEIRCDGRVLRARAIQIAVGNGRHYGGGMTVNREAAIDDGLLHLYCLEPQSLWRLLALLPDLREGPERERTGVRLLQGEHIEVHTRRPMPVSTDGELTTHTPARFRVVREALAVYVPGETAVAPTEVQDAAG